MCLIYISTYDIPPRREPALTPLQKPPDEQGIEVRGSGMRKRVVGSGRCRDRGIGVDVVPAEVKVPAGEGGARDA